MNAWIVAQNVYLLALPLPQPFRLGFGVLHQLPRVLVELVVQKEDGQTYRAYGEASMDFPFGHYDAWDIFYAIERHSIVGCSVLDRTVILDGLWKQRLQDGIFAAQASMNMVLDDAYGILTNQSVGQIYGCTRTEGRILESIGIPDSLDSFKQSITRIFSRGRIPKIKGDEDVNTSCNRLMCAMEIANAFDSCAAADFNATLTLDEWNFVFHRLANSRNFTRLLFVEQPTREELGMQGICEVADTSRRFGGLRIVADESFVTVDDAIVCGKNHIGMNMKIQKVGGLVAALVLEEAARLASPDGEIISMVGGTFPTALGRVYDQHAACVLKSAVLPSDGWQPASDWFSGDLHLMNESFAEPKSGYASAFSSVGLGCTPNMDHVRKWIVLDPAREYCLIRETGKGERIVIDTEKTHETYAVMYERLSGRKPFWNL